MSLYIETVTDENLHIQFDISDPDLTTVEILHFPSGIRARGNALRSPADIYSAEIGKSIALLRATERLSRKLERRIIRYLPTEA